jgi:CPA2 family monovalent cation:H+ antiporter-2
METLLLNDIVIIFGLAIVVLFIFHRLRLPTVVGFLLTGVFVGPNGLGLISAVHEVEILAEIGVVSLLFTIGIDFSLERLLQTKKSVLLGGSLQVVFTALATFIIAGQLGRTFGEAVFIGFLVALSSTAIVLRLIQERAEVDSPHGRISLGILIFQDIIIVPMILITPLLAGAGGGVSLSQSMLVLLAKGAGVILLVIVGAKWIVPLALHQIARTRISELFILSVVMICLGVAWLTSKAGLSLALGAFLAGLIISESEYSHHTLGNILPFRDIFTTFFFVSIGMLLDIGFLFRQPAFIMLIVLSVIVLKAFLAGGVTILLGFPLRTGILVGLALGQIGEFSFILSRVGLDHGLLTGNTYQVFLAVSVLSMAATPFMISLAPRAADIILRLPVGKKLKAGFCPVPTTKVLEKKDHLVIVGFGVNGRNLARAAKVAGIPYAVIEMNPDTVRSEQAKGEPICYGDATNEPILRHANLDRARIVVVAINDPTGTRRIIEAVRRLNRTVHLIVRTRYLQEMNSLYQLGADEVIPEEFETSVEIFTRVLTRYFIPTDEIEKLTAEARANGYRMLRSSPKVSASLSDLRVRLRDVDISAFRISPGSSLIGKTLAQIELRERYQICAVAIDRESEMLSNPGADTLLQSGDVLYLLGSSVKISEAIGAFSPPHKSKQEE